MDAFADESGLMACITTVSGAVVSLPNTCNAAFICRLQLAEILQRYRCSDTQPCKCLDTRYSSELKQSLEQLADWPARIDVLLHMASLQLGMQCTPH